MTLLLLLSSLARAAPSAESSVFAWADKCPSTAMRAGVYGGSDYAVVSVGGQTAYRFRSNAPRGMHPILSQSTLWMLTEGCRAVGLARLGDASTQPGRAYVGFVVAKDGGVPTEAEQSTLLTWAGLRRLDTQDPAQAAANAALMPTPPTRQDTPHGPLLRRGPPVWRDGPMPTQVEAWRADGSVLPVGASCPCWTVFTPGTASKNARGPLVAHWFGDGVTLLEDPSGRWAVEAAPPFFVDGGGQLRATDMDAAVGPVAGTPPATLSGLESGAWTHAGALYVALRDPANGASFVLSSPVPAGTTSAQARWTTDGIALPGGNVPAPTMLGWLRGADDPAAP